MVRFCLKLAAIALAGFWASDGLANQITFTGNVESDFPGSVQEGLRGIIIDNPMPGPPGGMPVSNPRDVKIPDWMLAEGRETGWNFKDIRLAYDPTTDSLAVGLNFFGIAGDVDGSGDPNSADPRTIAAGGKDEPRFSNGETVVVALDLNNDREMDVIVGIPLNKPVGPDGQRLDGIESFTMAKFADHPGGIAFGFGSPTMNGEELASFLGRKAIETSAEAPDMQFEITNFSTLGRMFRPDFDPVESPIGLEAFAGGLDDVIVGEDFVPYQSVSPQILIPEPSTLLGWSCLAGAAVWRFRRRRGSAS